MGECDIRTSGRWAFAFECTSHFVGWTDEERYDNDDPPAACPVAQSRRDAIEDAARAVESCRGAYMSNDWDAAITAAAGMVRGLGEGKGE